MAAADEWRRRGRAADAWAETRAGILEVDPSNAHYPEYYSRAKGARVWDLDGRPLIDFILGYGPVILGHADERVNAAAIKALGEGVCASPMWSTRQVELCELLVSVIQGAERALLMRTGSDATSAAIRLARIFTGRQKILRWGYNGWHDWTAPRPAGVTDGVRRDTLTFTYNDLDSVRAAFAEHPDQIACVIMMTFGLEPPQPGFLQGVRSIAQEHGALFIIDDMRSGFRVALGGSQEYFGVQADLATFSKAMANGFAISAIVGRADVLSRLADTHVTSTFCGNHAEMAAALETIRILRDSDALNRVRQRAEAFDSEIRSLLKRTGAPARLSGMPASPFIEFLDDGAIPAERFKVAFYAETLKRGILFHPNHQWYFCAAHTEDDIAQAVEACAAALENLTVKA